MRVLATLLLLAGALVPWAKWNERRLAVEAQAPPPSTEPSATPQAVAADLGWMEDVLGAGGAAPALADLRQRLARWRIAEPPPGWALLAESGRGGAARSELARWFELEPTKEGRVAAMAIEEEGTHTLLLRCDLAGPSPAVLPWVGHLLAMPRDGGYLSDVRQVQVERDGAELSARVVLAVRDVGEWRREREAALRGEAEGS